MIHKTKELGFAWGDKPGKRSGSISSAQRSTAIIRSWDQSVFLQDVYNAYRELATINVKSDTSYLGLKTFESTTRERPLFNNCYNVENRGFCYPFCATLVKPHAYNPAWDTCYLNRFERLALTSFAFPSNSRLKQHHKVDFGWARRLAWAEMQPRFEGDVSMFNFLLELKDVRELLSLLSALRPSRLLPMFKRLLKKKRLDPTKPMAEAHLLNEFAIKPLVSDIVTIIAQLNQRIVEVQKEFSEAGLGRDVRHWSTHAPVSKQTWEYNALYPYRFMGEYASSRFTATMEYSYSYSMRTTLDAMTRYWGIIPTWESVWNAMPFSFLLDYFFTIGRTIKAMEKDPNVTLQLSQYCESVTSQVSRGWHISHDLLLGNVIIVNGTVIQSPSGPVIVTGTNDNVYTRRVAQPNYGTALPRVKAPSSKQGRNLAALLRCFF